MKTGFALLVLVASASALPSPDAVVPQGSEADAATLKHHAAAKAKIAELVEAGSDDNACKQLANSMKDEITNAVSSSQQELDALDTGADCPNTLAAEVAAAQSALDTATTTASTTAAAATAAAEATVDYEAIPLSLLSPGSCDLFYQNTAYTTAAALRDSTALAASNAATAVTTAQDALTAMQQQQTEAIEACQCTAKKAYDDAWASATQNQDEQQTNWREGSHMLCVLDQTAPGDCDEGTVPTVTPIDLPEAVANAQCAPTPCVAGDGKGIYHLQGSAEGSTEGRLLWQANEWGTICDDGFNDIGATIACKVMGCDFGEMRASGGVPSHPIVLDDVQCTEADLERGVQNIGRECHGATTAHNCDHNEDVNIACFNGKRQS